MHVIVSTVDDKKVYWAGGATGWSTSYDMAKKFKEAREAGTCLLSYKEDKGRMDSHTWSKDIIKAAG